MCLATVCALLTKIDYLQTSTGPDVVVTSLPLHTLPERLMHVLYLLRALSTNSGKLYQVIVKKEAGKWGRYDSFVEVEL